VLRDQCPATFKLYQDRIREAGVKEKFKLRGRTATYRYYYAAGYKYWIIGVVLNRRNLFNPPPSISRSRAPFSRVSPVQAF
jgi:hypothetical protein